MKVKKLKEIIIEDGNNITFWFKLEGMEKYDFGLRIDINSPHQKYIVSHNFYKKYVPEGKKRKFQKLKNECLNSWIEQIKKIYNQGDYSKEAYIKPYRLFIILNL
ncbi:MULTISPECIES: hypothetical protein [Bacillus cereus group]|uniref:hypothetical protein n=1 Tax=Bacillus cereus group TaxID=86661 RepID=UPI000BFA900D|nr:MULTISPECIES: hypothetical protein [Bacillus cereus group]PEZ55071.1 hypothetical protein CN363_03890 [Bacillus cereus]PFL82870.1 hypothetical protein COJ32_01300 [Bacillus cereus]PGV08799.1 hypothetical protein COD81_12070 [Bacillus cereus]